MNVELQPDRRPPEEDEDLGELPPLDGSDDDAESPVEELDEGPSAAAEDGENLLDDTTGEGDPVEELVPEGAEGGWLDDSTDAEELDLGPDDLDTDERADLLEDADEPGVGEEDFGLGAGADAEAVSADTGEEGPEAEDEALREEDLPRLDADDDGELEDEVFVDTWPDAAEDERPPWDDRAWNRVAALPRVGMARSVVPQGAGALVAGATLVRVLGDTPPEAVGAEIHGGAIAAAATLSDGVVFATTDRGGLFAADGGEFRPANGWEVLAAGPLVELAAGGGRLWGRTRAGAVVGSDDRGITWRLCAEDGVAAIAATAEGELVTLRGDAIARGEPWLAWGAPLPELPAGARPILRARGRVVVVAALGAGAFRSIGGEAWERLEGTASVTALTLLDDDGTTLVALHAVAEDRTWIARVGQDPVARIVVELGGEADEGDDPRVLDLVWSDETRTAWAVGPFGVAAFRPR